MDCVRECRTFLWGGKGTAFNDEQADCFCVCEENQGWSEHNILGVPSCVPSKAHVVFGAVGVLASLSSLLHSSHHLNRQMKLHARDLAVSTMPKEQGRRHMHLGAVIHAVLSLCYFCMVLVLEDDQLWGSVLLLGGINQFTINIVGVLTTRMWIYSNDRRLMQDAPELLAISNALERKTGQRVSYGVVCIGAVISTALAAARRPEAAMKVAAVAFLCLVVTCYLIIWKFTSTLLHVIDKSMQKYEEKNKKGDEPGRNPGDEGEQLETTATATGKQFLVAARQNVKAASFFCFQMSAQVLTILLFAIFSPFGNALPMLLFGIPMGFAPLIWNGFNIQFHAGSRRPPITAAPRGPFSGTRSHIGELGARKWLSYVDVTGMKRSTAPNESRPIQRSIVPIEAPPTSP